MKPIIIFSVVAYLFFGSLVFAAELSESTNNLYLAVGAWRATSGAVTNEPIGSSDKLVFMAFCSTGSVELDRPLDYAYGIKVKMYDSDGKEIAKTPLGKTFGAKFGQLHSYTDTRIGIEFAEGNFKDNPQLGGGGLLPTSDELFKIKKPGIYTLEIQMQMFQVVKNTNAWSRNLFSFPPVKIGVEKLEN